MHTERMTWRDAWGPNYGTPSEKPSISYQQPCRVIALVLFMEQLD